tara:strand:+ start:10 stop:525 length:516 start_codon:yes stop_codon:yes gene_type:complete
MLIEYDTETVKSYLDHLQSEVKRIKGYQRRKTEWDLSPRLDIETFSVKDLEEWLCVRNALGVYVIWHKERAMYVGEGDLAKRIRTHICAYKKACKFTKRGGKGASKVQSSPVGRKMYRYDSDIKNWKVSFCESGTKHNAAILEYCLCLQLKPVLNEISGLAYLKNVCPVRW